MDALAPTRRDLNLRSYRIAEELVRDAERCGVRAVPIDGGGTLIDCGVEAKGGLAAGIYLARICLADLADVSITSITPRSDDVSAAGPLVVVRTDQPLTACMAAQYAGWAIDVDGFFAMGSGPMRALHGGEPLFSEIPSLREESAKNAVGVLESTKIPPPEVFEHVASKTSVSQEDVLLAVAPARSLAGTVQVVARSVETALHKLHHLGFDLGTVISGFGSAPLPPPSKGELGAIGRANDAVLYGARVHLWVRGDDDRIRELGPRVPSCSSSAHGKPFVEIFREHDNDFYKIDGALFSPAEVVFFNVESGQTHRFGKIEPEILNHSFAS